MPSVLARSSPKCFGCGVYERRNILDNEDTLQSPSDTI